MFRLKFKVKIVVFDIKFSSSNHLSWNCFTIVVLCALLLSLKNYQWHPFVFWWYQKSHAHNDFKFSSLKINLSNKSFKSHRNQSENHETNNVEDESKSEKPKAAVEDNRNGTDAEQQCDKKPDDAISETNNETAIPDVLSNENAVTPQQQPQQQNNNILSIKSKKNKKKGKVDAGNDEQKISSDASKA